MVVDVLAESPAPVLATALVTPERAWTYGQLDAEVTGRAEALSNDVAAGTVVPLVVEAEADPILSLLALWRVGAVPVPLHARLTEAERAAARDAMGAVPAETQVVLWTSGTAGRPRGVALSHANLRASARAAAARLDLGPRDVWMVSLSPAHVGGLALVVRALLLGSSLVVTGPFDTGAASDVVDGRGLPPEAPRPVTHLSLVPTQLLRILEHRHGAPPPPTFQCVLVGGAHAPSELVARAGRARWPLALTYGATEMCSQVATAPPELVRAKPGTVGPPLEGVEVRIAADGELLARGETRALAYVGAAPDAAPLADPDGWYRTGDLARLDADGDLWITGRRADRIVSGGVNVDAVEVEEALRAHPAVLDACVVGLADAEWGEVVAAWVEAVAGTFDPDAVADELRSVLSGPKLPRRWHLGGALPRNVNGKVDRSRVRAELEARVG